LAKKPNKTEKEIRSLTKTDCNRSRVTKQKKFSEWLQMFSKKNKRNTSRRLQISFI